jgi:hypothetical protein
VTYQQADVLDAIQDYRHAVASVGNLKSNQYQKVRVVPDRCSGTARPSRHRRLLRS